MYLNVDGYMISVDSNGPGRRLVLWLQGCTLACKGCFNKHLWPHQPNKLLEIGDLANYLIEKMKEFECEGITISGGEPFQQAKASGKLIENIKNHNFNIVIYTGYTYEELEKSNNKDIEYLLDMTDILIAGRYTGSSDEFRFWNENEDKDIIYQNQELIKEEKKIGAEFTLSNDSMYITGFPNIQELKEIKKMAKTYNLELA